QSRCPRQTPVGQSASVVHATWSVQPLPHCVHSAGFTLPGGLVPQPLEPVVKENSEGTPLQQSQQGLGEQVPTPLLTPPADAHAAPVRRLQVLKAPIGDDCTQH